LPPCAGTLTPAGRHVPTGASSVTCLRAAMSASTSAVKTFVSDAISRPSRSSTLRTILQAQRAIGHDPRRLGEVIPTTMPCPTCVRQRVPRAAPARLARRRFRRGARCNAVARHDPNSNPRHSQHAALATTKRLVDWRTHTALSTISIVDVHATVAPRAWPVSALARRPDGGRNLPHRLEFPGFAETAHEDRPRGDRCVRYHVPCLVR
jgi:hypothetical protein